VMASMRGFFFRVAFPSPTDMGQCFSTMSYILLVSPGLPILTRLQLTLTRRPSFPQYSGFN
jgi:hypothetical protein